MRKHTRTALLACVMGGLLASCPQTPGGVSSAPLYKRDVSAGLYDITPVRGAVRPLRLHRDGDEYECTACHDSFDGTQGEAALKDEHKDIVFQHGLNQRCLNCHNAKNSMAYAAYDGSEIPPEQPTRLCAKCHGPLFHEWQLGIHGRVNGHWDPKQGEHSKLECIQCHNPHHPKFEPMTPLPPPVLTRFDLRPPTGDASHGQSGP